MSGPAPASWSLSARTATAEDTRRLAAALSRASRPGDVVLLVGGLGAGKTTFAQGFARGLAIPGPVTSPTFTLVRQYPCAGPAGVRQLVHADVYRLESLAEVVDLGLPELVDDGAVALVEWGDVAAPALGPGTLTVELGRNPDSDLEPAADGAEPRSVLVRGDGEPWADRQPILAEAMAPFAAGGPSGPPHRV